LKFNPEFTEFFSLRILPCDFEFIEGKLQESQLIISGDSHGGLLFNGLTIPHRNLFHFGMTMFSQGRNRRIYNFKNDHLSPNTVYCLTFGEVDVRAHIGKQVYLGSHHLTVCKRLVETYISTIRANFTCYKAIIIVAVPPPVESEDHIHTFHTPPLPFVGTNSDRVIYTTDLNKYLEDACKQEGYYFFNPFNPYKRDTGTLKYELSDYCIHIGKNEHVLSEFKSLYTKLLEE
jgi:hypothetical protein